MFLFKSKAEREAKVNKAKEKAKAAAKKKAQEDALKAAVGFDYNSKPFDPKTKSYFSSAIKERPDKDILTLQLEFNKFKTGSELLQHLTEARDGTTKKIIDKTVRDYSTSDKESANKILVTAAYLYLSPHQRLLVREYIHLHESEIRKEKAKKLKGEKTSTPGSPPRFLDMDDYYHLVDYMDTTRFQVNATATTLKCENPDKVHFDDAFIKELVIGIIKKRDKQHTCKQCEEAAKKKKKKKKK